MIYLDTETVGLTGPVVLIQWAQDGGPVHTVHVVGSRPADLLALLKKFCDDPEGVCVFNLTFDWWQLCRLLQALLADGDNSPITAAWLSHVGGHRDDQMVMRPRKALDLMLHARSGPMQSLMERDDVRVRRVPAVLAEELCNALTERLELPDIYFHYRKRGAAWQVQEDPDDPAFPDVYLSFGAAGGLKPLARHLLQVDTVDFPIPEHLSFNGPIWDVRPLHRQLGEQEAERLIGAHAEFWRTSSVAARYAEQDVVLLRQLRRYWGMPPGGDTNSELAIAVACCRAVGFPIDPQRTFDLHDAALTQMAAAPRAPGIVLSTLHSHLDPIERLVVQDTTAETLEAVVKQYAPPHPAGVFAKRVADARSAEKTVDMLGKVLKVGYAAWDFKVVGTLSNRMSGGGGNNPQGVRKGDTREAFLMAQGGDFDGFEPAIAAAVYGDKALEEVLRKGLKINAVFGAAMYDKTYDEVRNSDPKKQDQQLVPGLGWDGDLYGPSKEGFLAWMYGAQDPKIAASTRLPEDQVTAGIERFFNKFPQLRDGRKRDQDAFCSMTQPRGLGTNVVWRDPAETVESLFGFKRYFTLENALTRTLYDLSSSPTEGLKALERSRVKVRRRADRLQTPGGAVRSALYAAAFQLQARNMRAAGNHRIQATGAHITKELELRCWRHQPYGFHRLVVQLMNVHDEVDEALGKVDLTADAAATVEEYRKHVPVLAMSWKTGLRTWRDL